LVARCANSAQQIPVDAGSTGRDRRRLVKVDPDFPRSAAIDFNSRQLEGLLA